MFLELLGVVLAGVTGALVVYAANRATGGRLPRWLMPAVAGLAMIAATISLEYSWYGRTVAALPEGIVVADKVEERAAFRPWTYLVPYVDRFVAVDRTSLRTNPDRPDERIATMYFFGRWAPLRRVPVAFDCAGNRRAALVEGADIGTDGAIEGADWTQAPPDDPLLLVACAGA
ncbi:hypothetical protein [Limimaricola cinnabarinus]|uniref:Uncharacterized protein n=1 Tax=Limimaricola cinnabarinus LL-001 TaxID=1337093 RepID=U3AR61_9RHOB|nr:hypothetical protein [Limimaricola cinnabarinus]GAD57223.1 hypothetical protein in cluster with DNA polymerase III epsilon subunit [Limimaricola cinnabarinus LL-001]